MFANHSRIRSVLLTGVAAATLAACSGGDREQSPADVTYQGSQPGSAAPGAPAGGQPDSRGVITYPDYQVVIARDGDTLEGIANRIGIPVAGLASYNGLPTSWRPRRGDTLVIPPDQQVQATPAPMTSYAPAIAAVPPLSGGSAPAETLYSAAPLTSPGPAPASPGSASAWSPELAESAIERAGTGGATAVPGIGTGSSLASDGQQTAGLQPVSHTVSPGETVYSISRLYNVPVSAIADLNNLGRDYTVRPGQRLSIPMTATANTTTVSADSVYVPGGQPEQMATPPSAADPLPAPLPQAVVPASPQLDQYRSNAPTTGVRLSSPVKGSVSKGYAPSGADRNDGIDFAAPAGSPVMAADDGEVALISNSLGGFGKILLIRHAGGLTTVYGRVDDVQVSKGDIVGRGQVIGSVAPADQPSLHFEVRRGAESVDPAGYL
ncbi:LysM peptidoglycan-binding domain-containing protein [Paroceanicella profunda]|uniref:LysM peptidoglycan-binding domain-containing protein n=1 Tax=Paroceanicella profunda TaxID=2579971 RepID=A0A5B8G1C6_9RHOB|nr:peptidoglycan DD-metalloendopeptidase family protein [Paroceanicella profunda]QDL92872.1 LysM peptidoglycan-binding domain-containing protein [Paroceanicella profunda]